MTRGDVQSLIGALLGGLVILLPIEELRKAVREIADSDELWRALELAKPAAKTVSDGIVQHVREVRDGQAPS